MLKPLKPIHRVESSTTFKIDSVLLVHISVSLVLLALSCSNSVIINTAGKIVMAYAVGLTFFFYFSHYKALANTKTYLLWLAVTIVQLLIYYTSRSRLALIDIDGSWLSPFRSLLVFLVLYQLLRQASLYFNHKEPVLLSRNEFNLTSLEIAASLPVFLLSLLSCFNL